MKPYNIMVVAGEASGEARAAELVADIKKIAPSAVFYGMGGTQMQKQGVELLENIKNTAVMGIFELLGKLYFLYKTLFKLVRVLKNRKPDVLILVDFQAFNLKLAKRAKKLGIKTILYIGPQVWAWRAYRLKKVGKIIDNIAVIFPFEVDFYQRHGLSVTYVGYPLTAGISVSKSRTELLSEYNIPADKTIIAFMPGSRHSEICQHMPIIKSVLEQLSQNKNVVCLLSRYDANSKNAHFFADLPDNTRILDDDFYSMLNAADFAVVASGTAALEAAILDTPMVVIVKVSKLSYLIYKILVRVKYICMVNIIMDCACVPELIQDKANTKEIIAIINQSLQQPSFNQNMRLCFKQVKDKLGKKPAVNLLDLVMKVLSD